jgi:hypothetical protein
MIRRSVIRVGLAALLLLVPTVRIASAGTAGPRIDQGVWTGTTSQGWHVGFDVLQSDRGLIVQPTTIATLLTCSATGHHLGFVNSFSGFSVPVAADGSFTFALYDELSGTIAFSGTLAESTGQGLQLQAVPGMTKDFGAEGCVTGRLSWTASAPGTHASAAHQRSATSTYHVSWVRDANGRVTESITNG